MAKTSNYRRWLRNQLDGLDEIAGDDERGHQCYDDVQGVVQEAGRRAAVAGLPAAVKLCNVRRGGLTVAAAREILAGCLAELPRPTKAKEEVAKRAKDIPLTIVQAATRLGIGRRKVYELCAAGELRNHKVGKQIRIRPADIDAFERDAVQAGPKTKKDAYRHFRR